MVGSLLVLAMWGSGLISPPPQFPRLPHTFTQFMVGSLLALAMWGSGAVPRPKITADVLLKTLPLAIAHTLGNVLTNISLGLVAVSFTHTIKV